MPGSLHGSFWFDYPRAQLMNSHQNEHRNKNVLAMVNSNVPSRLFSAYPLTALQKSCAETLAASLWRHKTQETGVGRRKSGDWNMPLKEILGPWHFPFPFLPWDKQPVLTTLSTVPHCSATAQRHRTEQTWTRSPNRHSFPYIVDSLRIFSATEKLQTHQ